MCIHTTVFACVACAACASCACVLRRVVIVRLIHRDNQIVAHEDGAPMAVGHDAEPMDEMSEMGGHAPQAQVECLHHESWRWLKPTHIMQRVFQLGVDPLGAGEVLDYDSSTYLMYHKMRVEWPCLSFDVVKDNRGAFRTKVPCLP